MSTVPSRTEGDLERVKNDGRITMERLLVGARGRVALFRRGSARWQWFRPGPQDANNSLVCRW